MSSIADFHLHGFDTSHFQPAAPNYAAGGRVFAILKADEATTYVDPNEVRNRDAAHAQGMTAVGLYHFARPANDSGDAEAKHFLQVAGARRPGEFAVLDFETNPWSEDFVVTYITEVQAAGWPVVFYTYRAMEAGNPHARIRATGAAFWVASYSGNTPNTDWPWTFCQHTDGQSSVAGNDGPWDCSVFHSNDLNELASFAGGAPQPQPQPQPPQQGDEMPSHFYRVSVDADNSQTAPGDNAIWKTDENTTHVISGPAWVHANNLKWWDESKVEFIPKAFHDWLVENTRGGNTG